MKKREKSNNVLKLLIMIFAITILVARVGSVKGVGGGGSANSPVESTFPVTIDSANPTTVDAAFKPEISSSITPNKEVYLGRTSTHSSLAIGTPGDTIKWRVTITGPSTTLTSNMIDLDEVGFNDPPDTVSNIATFHYPFQSQPDGSLVALGSCDAPDPEHSNDCAALIGFSLDDNDVFTNADKIKFNSDAPDGSYIIRYELVDTIGTPDATDDRVLSNAHPVEVTLDKTGPEIDPVSNDPEFPSCSDNTVEISATVIDISSINKVWLNYNVTNEFNMKAKGFRMSLIGDNSYKGDISLPPLNPTRDDGLEVTYEVAANDTLGNLAKSDLKTYTYDCQNPTASFTEVPVNPDEGSPVTFDASGSSDTVSNVDDLIFEWNFGDGNTGSGKTATHTYKDNGKYNVTLTVTDKAGNSDETSEIKVVNNVVPTVKDCVITPNPGNEGSEVSLTCSFTNPGILDSHTALVDWGDGAIEEGTITEVDGSGTVTASHTYKDNNDYNVVVNVTDKDDGIGTGGTIADIGNVVPTVKDCVITPNPGNEGSEVSLTCSFTNPGILDNHTALVDWGDETSIEDCPVTEVDGSGTADCSHVYKNNGDYTINVSVSDGLDTGFDTATATILDTLPTASFTENLTNPKEGQSVQFTDTSTSHDKIVSWHWEFGDGDTSDEQNPTHTYKDNGIYTVTLTVTDSDGSTDTTSEEKVVSNVAPTVDEILLNPNPGQEGTIITLTAHFTNPGVNDIHTATINWGDSTNVDIGTVNEDDGTVTGSHNYTDNKTYIVTLTVTDNDGGVGQDTTTADITDGTPKASFFQVQEEPKEGDEIQFTDTSTSPADDIEEWFWDFGDEDINIEHTSTKQNPIHTYLDDRTYNVTLTVKDEDGSTNTVWEMKVVSNAIPVVTTAQDQTTDEGSNISLTVATFKDNGTLDKHRARIDWGDGTEETIGLVDESAGLGTVSGWHIYKDDKEDGYTVKVRVFDELDEGIGTFNIKVDNVAPTIEAGSNQIISKGETVSISSTFSDPSNDTHTAVINWGDGTTTPGDVSEPNSPEGTVTGSHEYDDVGTFNVTVNVTDDDNASDEDALVVKVGLTLNFNQGWNLFSVPKVLENNNVDAVTNELDFSMILTYEDGQWIKPTTIDPLKAYWIKMNEPSKLLLTFRNVRTCTDDGSCIVPGSRKLDAGWQLIGFTDTEPLESRLALSSLKESYSYWFGFVNNAWIIHFRPSDEVLEPGLGYWVFMTEPSVLAALSI